MASLSVVTISTDSNASWANREVLTATGLFVEEVGNVDMNLSPIVVGFVLLSKTFHLSVPPFLHPLNVDESAV